MSDKFSVVIICIILAIFAFGGIIFLGWPREWDFLTFNEFLFGFLLVLLSLMSILGFLKKKIWAKWTGLVVSIIVLNKGIHRMIDDLLYVPYDCPKPLLFKGHSILEYLYLTNFDVGIPILGIIGIILLFSISKRYFYNNG